MDLGNSFQEPVMDRREIIDRLKEAFRWKFPHLDVATELITTAVPGYWRRNTACRGDCGEGHTAPMFHTYCFTDTRRDPKTGRWVTPYRTWQAWRDLGLPHEMKI